MAIKVDDVFAKMMATAGQAFGDGWASVKNYAPTEFRKMALQLVDIADNVAKYRADRSTGYSAATGKLLFQMQRNATEGVLVAISTLTLLAVQNAINAILAVLKRTFKAALKAVL